MMPRPTGLDGGGSQPHLRSLIHTETWAGSRAWCTTPAQVVPDRVQVYGVLQVGRERGHGLVGIVPGPVEPPVYTRRRTGLNRAAAASVAAATATGVWTRNTWVASSTSPA